MGRIVAKLADDKYVEWSSVVDAPVTNIMDRESMRKHLEFSYGTQTNQAERLNRADKNGTSSLDGTTLEDLLSFNRAGENEASIGLEEILKRYTEDLR